MDRIAWGMTDAVKRLELHDHSLKEIVLECEEHTDFSLAELIGCLLVHPNAITHIYLDNNGLTDETGIKLAHFISISKSIVSVSMTCNQFSTATYLAIAMALHINTSLQFLDLTYNQPVDEIQIDLAFVNALMLNPNRHEKSQWYLFSCDEVADFVRLKKEAEQLGHPNMQLLLVIRS